ncbi:type II toxin-antitoxin system YoeB family toxin [Capnocytophaga genosp. AHN8471]|jgi:addiction module toxin, txe/yoeB family|uniref:type II toxin-antitoxin system YoeB family toxin n=1 Tax=Capnocytophaga genosp. AHN8471 TaxID=327574 RepID=UPI001931BB93|nr:type II toxin-antitoxin system YoeB family toxin [Capnocytophaga genosp. AHN8471]MBM0652965.1 type II toxin-antitoxin system YoeB family toxin [Capnocytophaga genosp. AHN8471]MBM0658769.1 type II toxin-antitoxin system YoeB family toxin [Capnocytophaga genosp. AHN8471]
MDDIEKDYEIEISKEAKKELELIKKSATSAVKSKLQRILEELQKHPTEGIGVERLKGKGGIGYSRELSKKDRVVYVVLEEEKTVVISQFLNHYKDK